VIIDWGGVMTNPILDTVNAWLTADGIIPASYLAVMRLWIGQAYGTDVEQSPIHALERGECADEEFERALAERLERHDGGTVEPAGLLSRMFAATVVDSTMRDLVRTLRTAGLRTALLSNSWGRAFYPRHLLSDLFDAVVISCEIGMRKPEERIFLYTARLLGLAPGECVFIDDIEANVTAAEAVGLIAVLHLKPRTTAQRLSELLSIRLD
jgi:putative hydrolase of the HAD superfamily